MGKFILLQTTCQEKDTKILIQKVFESGLVFCVQSVKIQSDYIWQGKKCSEEEIQITFKTKTKYYPKLKKLIKKFHSYEIPEIIALKINKVSKAYKKWALESIKESVTTLN